jgi:hypothetical protein
MKTASKSPIEYASFKARTAYWLEELIVRSWWVVLFVLACYFCYEQGLRKKDREHGLLQRQYDELLLTRKKVKSLQQHLKMKINSQEDPATVELTLMRELGLVPQGQTKVLFK